MAQRAKVFDALDHVDYSRMRAEDFDWHAWVEQEMRNRFGTPSCVAQTLRLTYPFVGLLVHCLIRP